MGEDDAKFAAMGIFPIERRARDTGHYVDSPHRYRKVFTENRPKDLTWYAYDVIIHSPTEVEFVVYDMRDNLSGGIGDEVARFKAPVPADLTHDDVEQAILASATEHRENELANAERVIIDGYAAAIRAALTQPKEEPR